MCGCRCQFERLESSRRHIIQFGIMPSYAFLLLETFAFHLSNSNNSSRTMAMTQTQKTFHFHLLNNNNPSKTMGTTQKTPKSTGTTQKTPKFLNLIQKRFLHREGRPFNGQPFDVVIPYAHFNTSDHSCSWAKHGLFVD
jgi:hypothetical protein